MKIKPEHYHHIRAEILSALQKAKHTKKSLQELKKTYTETGLSDRRFNWDMWHMSNLSPYACSTLYEYANDEHIDSALRKIMKEVLG